MKKIILGILIIMLGAIVLMYPRLSSYFLEKNNSYAVRAYEEEVDSLDEKEASLLWKEAELYNQSLTGISVYDPFSKSDDMVIPNNYYEILNIDGIMGYIEIPKISVYLPIFHGTSEQVLKKGIGHLEGSTMPIGGNSRNCVLTGHTGLSASKFFTDLTELVEGDLFYLHILGEVLAYEVDQTLVVEPSETEELARFEDKDYCTLLTCTPYGVNSHRLLVRGIRTEYKTEVKNEISQTKTNSGSDNIITQIAIITSFIMLVLVILTAVISRIRNKERNES